MATIQVREIPEDLYEVLRRRARRAGQSLQAYMRDQVMALAQQPTKQLGCQTLHSEDLNSGQEYEGIQVRSPFLA